MKSKKLIGALVAVVMSASLSAALAACGGGDHSHSWQYRDIGGGYHRQECSCGEYKEPEGHHDVDGNDVCDECQANLAEVVAVVSVSLDKTSETLTVGGETLTLTATVNPEGAATVLWESSDVAVATVSTSGVVTPVKAGTATITATAGDKSATCDIVVNAAPPTETVEMDEEKWAAAFTFGDKIGVTSVVTVDGEKQSMAIKIDGKKAYTSMSGNGFIYENYNEETDDNKLYTYTEGYGYWTKELNEEESSIDDIKAAYLTLTPMFPFDKFKNGEVNGEYVAKGEYTVNLTTGSGYTRTVNVKSASLHFDGSGKLISLEYVTVEDEEEVHTYATLDYNPKVTLPTALLGGEVTDEQWSAALAMQDSNYRVGVKLHGVVLNEFKRDGNKRYTSYGTTGKDGSVTYDETYYSKDSGGIYEYKTAHDRTTKQLTAYTDEQYAQMTAIQFFGIDTADYVKSNFTFDEVSKSYNATLNDQYYGETKVSVKFKNGKLVWARQKNIYFNYTVEFVYGDTKITIPAVTAGAKVSDDEWTAALEMSDSRMQMEIDVTSGSFIVGEMVGVKDGDKLYQVQKTGGMVTEMYAVKDGDKYYGYSVYEGKWVKSEMPQTEYNNYLPSAIFTGLNKEGFEWNATSQSYVKTTSEGIGEIRFVNKKVDYVVQYNQGMTMKYYFSYGSGMVTLPTEGAAADSDDYPGSGNPGGGGGGGGQIVDKPSIDIDEKEWGAIFENVYACPEFEVLVQSTSGDYYQYDFRDEDELISIAALNEKSQTVYQVVEGTLKKIVMGEGEPEEQDCEFSDLTEAKNELIGRFFEIEGKGNIIKLFNQFAGIDGSYHYYEENGDYIHVDVQEGKLRMLEYGSYLDGSNYMITFNYPTSGDSEKVPEKEEVKEEGDKKAEVEGKE